MAGVAEAALDLIVGLKLQAPAPARPWAPYPCQAVGALLHQMRIYCRLGECVRCRW